MQSIKEYFALLFHPSKIDIFDINYIYSSAIFVRFLESGVSALPKRGIFIRILIYFYHLFQQINIQSWINERKNIKGSIFLYSITHNQRKSLEPVAKLIPGSILFGAETQNPFSFISFLSHILSIPFIFHVFQLYFSSTGLQRESFKYNFDRYLLTYGSYYSLRMWIRHIKPKIIIFANDHSMECRVFRKVAQEEKIITVYLQHASVTPEFPVLEFDYAFLDGMDALKIYDSIGQSKTLVFLTGSPKFDDYYNIINKSNTLKRLGVCTNSLDPIPLVDEIIKDIQSAFPEISIYIRPHPGDKRKRVWKSMADSLGILFSDPKVETAYSFLSRIDGLVAGNSNIHLEAVMVNVYPLFFDFSQKPHLIKYSFINNGLCEYFSEINSLLVKIGELCLRKPNIRERAKVYNEQINTPFDGRSGQLAQQLIINILSDKSAITQDWEIAPCSKLKVYKKV